MNKIKLEELLTDLRDKNISVEEAMEKLKLLPFEDIGVANIDHHRELRKGAPEVIFGQGKRAEDIGRSAESDLCRGLSAGCAVVERDARALFRPLSAVGRSLAGLRVSGFTGRKLPAQA